MVLVLSAADVATALDGREHAIVDAVREAYLAHRAGRTAVPHSAFLRLPGDEPNRIIALPAYLGAPVPVAGCKWIASVPANVRHGRPRASAVIVLNDPDTGAPTAILEGSLISAARTAASAALAAVRLSRRPIDHVAIVGCGLINRTILRFLAAVAPELEKVTAFDVRPEAAATLGEALDVAVAPDLAAALSAAPTVSFATTATRPYVSLSDLGRSVELILHVSLRDLKPDVVHAATNVVDDAAHVLREGTSLALAGATEGLLTIGEVLRGGLPVQSGTTVFSPFGLGILDLAVARLVVAHARAGGRGVVVEGFADPC
jgi:2,3-diaminopropionate biosynthesis protein SbnB